MNENDLSKQLTEHYQSSAPTRLPDDLESRFRSRAAHHNRRRQLARGGAAALAIAAAAVAALTLPNLNNERTVRVEPAHRGDSLAPTPGPTPTASTAAIALPPALPQLITSSQTVDECKQIAPNGSVKTQTQPNINDAAIKSSGKTRPWARQTRFISVERQRDSTVLLVIRDIDDDRMSVPVGTVEAGSIASQLGRSRDGATAFVRISRPGGPNPVDGELGDTTLLDIDLFHGSVRIRGKGFAYTDGQIAGTGALTRFATSDEYARTGAWVVLDLIDGSSKRTLTLATNTGCTAWNARPGNVTWLGKDRLSVQARMFAPSERTEKDFPRCCGAMLASYRTRVVNLATFPDALFEAPESTYAHGPETETAYRDLVAVESDEAGHEVWGYFDETNSDARELRWDQVSSRSKRPSTLKIPNPSTKRLYNLQLRVDARHWIVGPAKGNLGTHIIDLFDSSSKPVEITPSIVLQK